MPETITINLLDLWLFIKTVSAIGLLWVENKYFPQRLFYHKVRRFLFHMLVNPELGAVKLLCLMPMWLLTGNQYLRYFLPIALPEPDYKCIACKDTGMVWHPAKRGLQRVQCSCQIIDYWEKVAEKYR